MRSVAFDRLVDFVVNCKMPLPLLVSGVNAISYGRWYSEAAQECADYEGRKVVQRTIENVSLLNRIFLDLSKDRSIPDFRSMMPSDEYDCFVRAYIKFVMSRSDDYWVPGGRLSVSIFDTAPVSGNNLYWVPRASQEMSYDLCVGGRERLRSEIARDLKSMCLDVARLNPYLQGSPEFMRNSFIKPEGAWLFLALMGVGVVQDAAFVSKSDDILKRIVGPRFDKDGWVFWSAKKVILDCIGNDTLRLVDARKFRQLFYVDSSEWAKTSGLICGEANKKGWFVKPWWTMKESKGKKKSQEEILSASDFRNRKCSQFVHDTLMKMWRSDCEIPTESALRSFWFDSLENRSGNGMIQRDPSNENMLMIYDVNNGVFVGEKEIEFNRLISKFVGVVGF